MVVVMMTTEQREQRLAAELQRRATDGWQVDTFADPFTVTLRRRAPVNHVMHAILSLLTLGLWLIVWLVVVMVPRTQRMSLRVDESGMCGPFLPGLAAMSEPAAEPVRLL
jgi:hypothetical protein